MIVRLVDILGDYIRSVEVPDNVLAKISALTHDGVPYLRVSADCFQMCNGYYATRNRYVPDAIDMARIFEKPLTHDLRTTRWFSGIVGEALFDIDVTVTIPWAESFTMRIRDTRPIRVNSLWCPEWSGEMSHGIPAAVRAAFVQSQQCRNVTNDFCNKNRPKGTRIEASIAGVDTTGRLVVDIHKVIPGIGSMPEKRLSLQEELLNSKLFQPVGWRTR